MDTDHLAAALRDCAAGLYPLEAGTGLLISNASFLHREDFTSRFIEHGTSGGIPMAAIDWDAAITALASGDLPCSGGERRILQLSASLAGGIPLALRDTVTGLDNANTARVITAIRRATGMRPGSSNRDTGGHGGKQLWNGWPVRPGHAQTRRQRLRQGRSKRC
jgi:hypothetical protein